MNKFIKNYKNNGYVIVNVFKTKEIDYLYSQISNQFIKILSKHNLDINELTNYHNLKIPSYLHDKLMRYQNRQFEINTKISNNIINNKIINEICVNELKSKKIAFFLEHKDSFRKNFAGLRVAKPYGSTSGIHAEGNSSPNYDAITLWVQLRGFSSKYTLNLSPKSHLQNHSSSKIKKDKYIAKSYSDKYVSKFDFIRPNLKKGQAILFHPNLLHGGSTCIGSRTRVSFEIRIHNIKSFTKKNNKYFLSNYFKNLSQK